MAPFHGKISSEADLAVSQPKMVGSQRVYVAQPLVPTGCQRRTQITHPGDGRRLKELANIKYLLEKAKRIARMISKDKSTSIAPSKEEEKEHRWRKICTQERKLRAVNFAKTLLGCAACKALHRAKFFEGHELAYPPERRRCRGSSFLLNVCQHLDMDWEDIQQLMATAPPSGQQHFCMHGFHGLVPPLSKQHECEEVTMTKEPDGSVVVKKQLVLAHCPSDAPMYPPLMLQRRLEQLEQRVCPHVLLDQDHLWEGHVEATVTRQVSHISRSKQPCMCCGAFHWCKDPYCETEWKVVRRKGLEQQKEGERRDQGRNGSAYDGSEPDEVVLEIVRRVGKMLDGEVGRDGITGKRWLAQVMHPKELGAKKRWGWR